MQITHVHQRNFGTRRMDLVDSGLPRVLLVLPEDARNINIGIVQSGMRVSPPHVYRRFYVSMGMISSVYLTCMS